MVYLKYDKVNVEFGWCKKQQDNGRLLVQWGLIEWHKKAVLHYASTDIPIPETNWRNEHVGLFLVTLNYGMNKMGDFSNDEGICIYLVRYRFLKHVTIKHVASSKDVLDSVIKQHGMYTYAHNRVLVHMSSLTTGDSGYMLHWHVHSV